MSDERKWRCSYCLHDRPRFEPPCPHCGVDRVAEEMPKNLSVWVCPYCTKQYRGPGGHHVAGDDCATSCSHRHQGERGVTQPKLVRVAVVPAEPFERKPIPHDQPIRAAAVAPKRKVP